MPRSQIWGWTLGAPGRRCRTRSCRTRCSLARVDFAGGRRRRLRGGSLPGRPDEGSDRCAGDEGQASAAAGDRRLVTRRRRAARTRSWPSLHRWLRRLRGPWHCRRAGRSSAATKVMPQPLPWSPPQQPGRASSPCVCCSLLQRRRRPAARSRCRARALEAAVASSSGSRLPLVGLQRPRQLWGVS